LVEFLGLPGAGKSRLCEEIGQALRRSAQPVTLHLRHASGGLARLATAGGLAAFALRHPRTVRCSLRGIRAAAPADRAWLTRTWLKRSALATRLQRAPGIHLIDAGVVQALWSFASRISDRPLEAALDALVERAPLPDVLIQLDVDPPQLRQRLDCRPRQLSRLERQRSGNPGLLDHGQTLVGLVADHLAASDPLRPRRMVLRNNDESDLLRNVDHVVALLTEPLAASGAGDS
jgi:hypothetical protein